MSGFCRGGFCCNENGSSDGCTACFSATNGDCRVCGAGHYLSDQACAKCPRHLHSPEGSEKKEDCVVKCDANHYQWESDCVACPEGRWSKRGAAKWEAYHYWIGAPCQVRVACLSVVAASRVVPSRVRRHVPAQSPGTTRVAFVRFSSSVAGRAPGLCSIAASQ